MLGTTQSAAPIALGALETKIDALVVQVDYLVQRQRYQSEMIEEMWPILNEVVHASTERFAELEERGYFSFAREAMAMVDRVVQHYSEEDVQQLGDSIVGIVDTIKQVTQPAVLALASEATEAIQHADEAKPVGMMGVMRATRDAEVQQGLAVMLQVLRHIGKASKAAGSRSRDDDDGGQRSMKLGARLAPSKRPKRIRAEPRPSSASKPAAGPKAAAAPEPVLDPKAWTRELAIELARGEGIELSDGHWKILEYARADFFEQGASPNIRRITKATGMTTRDLYALFPRAPARTVSLLAGIPKPAGCI